MSTYFVDHSEEGYGPVFVPKGAWQPGYKDLLAEKGIAVVRLSASMGWRGTDLSFLRDLPELRGIEIYSPEVRDASVISSLGQLRLVGLDCDLRSPIDFGGLDELEVVKARWTDAIDDVVRRSQLTRLNLTNWPWEDLGPITSMTRLSRLELTSRKLTSLSGIGRLRSLEWLDLHMCPKLGSLHGLGGCDSISYLAFTSCKAVHDISPVGDLGALRRLHFDNNGEVATLAPLRSCKALEEISFFGSTRVIDGRISVLEDLPRLRTLRFAPRRHYDRRREEVTSGRA